MSFGRLSLRGLSNGEPLRDIAFRTWFGRSRIVDAAGRPLVLYHGTKRSFLAFDLSRTGQGGWKRAGAMRRPSTLQAGIYLTTARAWAEDYAGKDENTGEVLGTVLEVYASIQRPLRIDAAKEIRANAREDLRRRGRPASADAIYDWISDRGAFGAFDADRRMDRAIVEARAGGFDGVIVDWGDLTEAWGPYGEDELRMGWTVIALDPRQVKSVENCGTWSRESANLLEGLSLHRRLP